MFTNFSNFLSRSLRILGIANRAIPLVKEITPTIKSIRSKLTNTNLPKLNLPQTNNNIVKRTNTIKTNNNSLTFFK